VGGKDRLSYPPPTSEGPRQGQDTQRETPQVSADWKSVPMSSDSSVVSQVPKTSWTIPLTRAET